MRHSSCLARYISRLWLLNLQFVPSCFVILLIWWWYFINMSHYFSIIQWEFQDPKMEVLYHIRTYFVGIFPYIGHHRPWIGLIYGRYLHFRILKFPLNYRGTSHDIPILFMAPQRRLLLQAADGNWSSKSLSRLPLPPWDPMGPMSEVDAHKIANLDWDALQITMIHVCL